VSSRGLHLAPRFHFPTPVVTESYDFNVALSVAWASYSATPDRKFAVFETSLTGERE